MGTPDFALEALKALVERSDHNVIAVYSQPPRPSGRGQKLTKSVTHQYAESQNIPVYTPLNFKKSTEDGMAARKEFSALNADIAVVAAYGLILPQAVLDAPKHGCLNIHGSLLPRWRGAAPIQRAIWDGDTVSGITIMQMERGLDTGPMILKGETPITAETTATTLHDTLAQMGGDLIIKTLDQLDRDGDVQSEKQDDALSTYAHMLAKTDGQIDWTQSAAQIDQQIRALNPWPGTYTSLQDKILKITTAQRRDDLSELPAGTLINKHGDIACGKASTLRLTAVKPANSKAMDIVSAINGGHIKVGDILC